MVERHGLRQHAGHEEARGDDLGLVEAVVVAGRQSLVGGDDDAVPHIGHRRQRHQAQQVGGGAAGLVGVLHRVLHQEERRVLHAAHRLLERLDELLHRLVGLVLRDEAADLAQQALRGAAALHRQLAADQVERLDAVGAFVELGDARVADELLHAVLADEAVAAPGLHREVGALAAHVGEVGLDDGRQHLDEIVGRLARRGVGMRMRLVDQHADPQRERAGALGEGLLDHQHAAHVGMHDDRIGRAVGILRPRQRAALQAVARIGDRALIGRLGNAEALHADAEAGGVHHDEHRRHALVGLADQPAGGAVEVHHAGGVGLDAHLVLEGAAADAVALADRTVRLRQELRHDEQRDALGAARRIRQARQHEMDDVLGEIVLAGGDEYLGAGDAVAAVGLRLGLGAQHAEVGAAMGFGEAHGARPGAVGQLRQVALLQLVGAMARQRLIGAVAEAGIHREGLVRGGEHLLQREAHRRRQPLPAELGIAGDARPAALGELLVGFLEALGRAHDAVLVVAAFLVAGAVQREQHVLAELGGFLDDGVDRVGGRVLVARQLGELRDVDDFVQNELNVLDRGLVDGHGFLLGRSFPNRFPDRDRAASARRSLVLRLP